MSTAFVVRPRAASGAASAPAIAASAAAPRAAVPAPAAGPAVRPRLLPAAAALAPFAPHLADPAVTDLFVNGTAGLFVDRGGGAQPVAGWQATEEEVRALAVDLIGLGDRHLDDATPCADVRLDGGLRVHAVLPPVSRSGTAISIRAAHVDTPDLDALAARGMFDRTTLAELERFVADRITVLITGAAGTGKTTLLAALLGRVPAAERIVTIEDVAELAPTHPHHVRLEARQPNLEGAGGIGLARLVRESLRMRPDRIVVGECRGDELREMLLALSSGHDGGAGTLHAGRLQDVPARLEALGALAGMDPSVLARLAAGAIGRVIHLHRGSDGVRRVAGIARPVVVDGRLTLAEES